jgi:peptidylprolyl isomerase
MSQGATGEGAPSFDPATFGGEDLSGDGGVYKKVLVPGDDSAGFPPVGSTVRVHYVGTLTDGSVFDSSRDRPGFFEFDIGLDRVISGWDLAVATMRRGERCAIACRADYAYGEEGLPPKCPGGATLIFEIELFSWKDKRKDRFDLDNTERLVEAEKCKARGTDLFKEGNFGGALDKYADARWYLDSEEDDFVPPDGRYKDCKTLFVSCCLNGATCALKLEEFEDAEALASKALERDAKNAKGYFRRGTARMLMGNFTDAKADLREAATLEPKSKEIRDAYTECVEKAKLAKKEEAERYRKALGVPKKTFGPNTKQNKYKASMWDFSV